MIEDDASIVFLPYSFESEPFRLRSLLSFPSIPFLVLCDNLANDCLGSGGGWIECKRRTVEHAKQEGLCTR
jgi:hypothetical protein